MIFSLVSSSIVRSLAKEETLEYKLFIALIPRWIFCSIHLSEVASNVPSDFFE